MQGFKHWLNESGSGMFDLKVLENGKFYLLAGFGKSLDEVKAQFPNMIRLVRNDWVKEPEWFRFTWQINELHADPFELVPVLTGTFKDDGTPVPDR